MAEVINVCGLNEEDFKKAKDKITNALSVLCLRDKLGGNPFFFSLIATKTHNIVDSKTQAASTDGKVFYWNHEFLSKLTNKNVEFVMRHELLHILLSHCRPERVGGRNSKVWNIAVDYFCNALIEKEYMEIDNENGTSFHSKVWTGAFDKPISLDECLSLLEGKPSGYETDKFRLLSDLSVLNSTPEEIYEIIMKKKQDNKQGGQQDKNNQKGGKGEERGGGNAENEDGDGEIGDGEIGKIDDHMETKSTKEEVAHAVEEARQMMKSSRGKMPSYAESVLKELSDPELTMRDFIAKLCMKKSNDGELKNWSVFNRRPEHLYRRGANGSVEKHQRLYRPTKKGYTPKFLALIDTSGSMSDDDIAHGVKELKALLKVKGSSGVILPCDSTVKWDAATSVDNVNDLKSTKIVGRGGTCFNDFFTNYKEKVGGDFDVIVVITDGDADVIDIKLKPSCDVVWVYTRRDRVTTQSFGKSVFLKSSSL